MLFPDSFKVSTPSDREIRVTRDFDARRRLVFDAFTKPELVRRWLLGPPGWTMPIPECHGDRLKPGGYCRAGNGRPGERDEVAGHSGADREGPVSR